MQPAIARVSSAGGKILIALKAAWINANPQYNFSINTSIQNIDEVLHEERINRDGSKKTYEENISQLPDGAFIKVDEKAYLLSDKKLHLWTPFGYKETQPINCRQKSKRTYAAFHCKYVSHWLFASNECLIYLTTTSDCSRFITPLGFIIFI